jgi:hypothetical protein
MEHDEPVAHGDAPLPASPRDGLETEGEVVGLTDEGAQPLSRVRFGLGKELRLYPDEFVVAQLEAGEELRLRLAHLRRLILAPGEQVPSKLVLMFDLDDGNTIIAAEGMSNVRDFRRLLARLVELKPDLELDPPNMDEQLAQALDRQRRSLLGCYTVVAACCIILWLIYMVVAFIGAHGPH